MRPNRLLLLVALTGCGASSNTASAPASTVSTRWATATTPEAFVPLAPDELQRLRQSVLSTRPQSTVDVQGRRSKDGFSSGVVWVMSAEHPDLENSRGMSLRQLAAGLRESTETQASARGLPAPSGGDFRLIERPDDNQIELNWMMRGPSGKVLENRALMGLRSDGVLLEAVCSCSEVGCARERCSFSMPTAGLLPIDTRFEAPRDDDELEYLDSRWASVRVPKTYVALSPAEQVQLPSKSIAGMQVEFKGRRHPAGAAGGLAYVRSVDHEPLYSYGRTLTEVVKETRLVRANLEDAVPAGQRLAYTLHEDPSDRVIELRGAQPEESATRSHNRSVFTFLTDGTLREAECFCDANVCSVDDCTLDVGDADRAPIDTPVFPGGEPKHMSLGEGAINFDVPPFLEQLDAAEAAKIDWVPDATHLQGTDRLCFASPQDEGIGFVCAAERRWCAEGACTVDDVTGYAKAEANMLAEAISSPTTTVKPVISQSQRMRTTAGKTQTVREFSAKVGRTVWRKSVVWADGDVVRERTCTCSGNPCRLMEKTCAIAEPLGDAHR